MPLTFLFSILWQITMQRLTPEQRLQIVEIYFQNSRSVRQTYRALRPHYGAHNRPSEQLIRNTMDRFMSTFTLMDNIHPVRAHTVRTEEAIAAVEVSVTEDPNLSIRRRSQALGLCPSTTWKILRKDLGLHPYKIQLVQQLKPMDHRLRRTFGEWAENQLEVEPHFYREIIFSDEAHFWLNGYVNKQNCRFRSEHNPHETLETPLHPEKLTVWCGLHAGGIIGPYFFKTADGANVTVNGDRYRQMIRDFLIPHVNTNRLRAKWFQQDGATCHTARETINLLRQTFGNQIISRNGPVNWPPRSCDLTPLDYFLWGYVKSLVYADKPTTIGDLEVNIRRVIAEIRPAMLEKVVQNWTDRMAFIRRSRGGHMPEIVFKH